MIAACLYGMLAVLSPDLCQPPQPPLLVPAVWHRLAVCESGMGGQPRWDYDGPSGFDGGLQFHPRTWTAFRSDRHPDHAHEATPVEQITVARRVRDVQGWQAWPSCSAQLGLYTTEPALTDEETTP